MPSLKSLCSKFLLYPSSEYLNISFYAPEEMEVQLIIFDMSGRVIEVQNLTLENDKQEIQIDVTSYESGIYMVSLVGEKGRVVEKFTVVR